MNVNYRNEDGSYDHPLYAYGYFPLCWGDEGGISDIGSFIIKQLRRAKGANVITPLEDVAQMVNDIIDQMRECNAPHRITKSQLIQQCNELN